MRTRWAPGRTSMSMKIADTRIDQGGLMRCCISTIVEYAQEHPNEEATDRIIDCKYEEGRNQQIMLVAGKWRWAGLSREEASW